MSRKSTLITAITAAILLAGCGEAENAEGLTAAEQRELDEAAAQLDEAQAEFEQSMQQPAPPDQQAEPVDEQP